MCSAGVHFHPRSSRAEASLSVRVGTAADGEELPATAAAAALALYGLDEAVIYPAALPLPEAGGAGAGEGSVGLS